jgi:hypothetical protein
VKMHKNEDSDEFDRENDGLYENKSNQLDNIINSVLDGKHLFNNRIS